MQVLIDEKIQQLKSIVLPLIDLAGGEIHRYNVLQLALYRLKENFLPSYKFTSKNLWGPADVELRKEMNYLCGFIEFEISHLDNGKSYGVYRLTSKGRLYAKLFEHELSQHDTKYAELVKIANCIKVNQKQKSLTSLVNCLINC